MIKYEILNHSADLKIRVFGKMKEELFLNALLGMMDALRPKISIDKKTKSRIVKIKSPDQKSLLVDFLNEALYLSQVNKEAYTKVQFKIFSDNELGGLLNGKKVERFNEDIKAVTYHNLEIKTVQGHWEAIILFDV